MADQQFQLKFVQEGDAVDYTPGADVAAGKLIQRGGLTGVTKRSILSGVLGAMAMMGVYDVVKRQVAFSDGDPVYWDTDGSPYGGTALSGAATEVGSGNIFIGYAIGAKLSTDPTVRVRLEQVPATLVNGIDDSVADPGASGAIPITNSGRIAIVTAGAETRTLAAPTFAGQQILIYMKTDGGDCVITCATTIAQSGTNTITLNDAGDAILLTAVEQGSNKRWRLAVNDGCTLSTV